MEHIGFEPTASTMRMWRASNCANAPYQSAPVLLLEHALDIYHLTFNMLSHVIAGHLFIAVPQALT